MKQGLSLQFDISESDIYNIIVTWTWLMSLQQRGMNIWPLKDLVLCYSPSDFATKLPKMRVIVCSTKCFIQEPSLLNVHQATLSSYTVKMVIGCTPGELISYISPAYGGSTSDHQSFTSHQCPECDFRCMIMADKGFNIEDIFTLSMSL